MLSETIGIVPLHAIVEVSHLHRRYGATVAVDDVSFTVAEGEIFGAWPERRR